jgi:hypothetical protein
MPGAWTDLAEQGDSAATSSSWLIKHLLHEEHTDRALRSANIR